MDGALDACIVSGSKIARDGDARSERQALDKADEQENQRPGGAHSGQRPVSEEPPDDESLRYYTAAGKSGSEEPAARSQQSAAKGCPSSYPALRFSRRIRPFLSKILKNPTYFNRAEPKIQPAGTQKFASG